MSRRDAGRLRGGQRKPGAPAVQASGMKQQKGPQHPVPVLSQTGCSREMDLVRIPPILQQGREDCVAEIEHEVCAPSWLAARLAATLPPHFLPLWHCPAHAVKRIHSVPAAVRPSHSPAPSGLRPTAAAAGSPGSSCAAPACPVQWQRRWSRRTCQAAGSAEKQAVGRQGSKDDWKGKRFQGC